MERRQKPEREDRIFQGFQGVTIKAFFALAVSSLCPLICTDDQSGSERPIRFERVTPFARPDRTCAEPCRSDFTLLEMLVALALVSVIAGALYGSLHVAFKARESAEAAVEPVRRAELTITLIRGDVESVLPPTGLLAAEFVGEDATDAGGRDADTLVLHSSANIPAADRPACDIRMVELSCEPDDTGKDNLIVRRITTRLLAPETAEPVEEVLCRNVEAFNLRYFDGSGWVESWNSSSAGNALPEAVEVTIAMRRERSGMDDLEPYRVARVLRVRCDGPTQQRGGRINRASGGS
jgi:general secretion pathway protein J